VLDQSQTATSAGATPVDSDMALAQTFTAGITGNLDQVDLFLIGGSPGDLTVRIEGVSGGSPDDGNVLASVTVPAASLPGSPGDWLSIPIGPVAVGAGAPDPTRASLPAPTVAPRGWWGSRAPTPHH